MKGSKQLAALRHTIEEKKQDHNAFKTSHANLNFNEYKKPSQAKPSQNQPKIKEPKKIKPYRLYIEYKHITALWSII